jgi:4-hydroxy-3-methylbut-2-enyl diphosphate reductase
MDFMGARSIGVTAGASTPAFIIKEVQEIMSDVLNGQDEVSFAEMLDQSFKTITTRERVTATVTSVSPAEIAVDIGTKHAGYVPLSEYTDDPNAKLSELVQVGDKLDLIVLRVNDVEGTAMLSKKRLDAIAGFDKVMAAVDTGEILDGIVVDVVKGGVIALTKGVRVFIPASQATLSRGQELETLLRQPVSFKILEVNRNRRRAVGSIRAVLKEQQKGLEEKFWETAAVGNAYKGTVKSLTNYGAFVDLGGVDGMIHISELSWSRVKHPSEIVNVGDVVDVYVREIDPETRKISLGYKKTEDNPWEVLKSKFQTGDEVTVQIVSLTPFGAFARLIPGVDGLIHISQISIERVSKPADALEVGQEVTVRITDIDFEKKRVSLSIRALLEEQNAQQEQETAEDADALVYEAAPPEADSVEE